MSWSQWHERVNMQENAVSTFEEQKTEHVAEPYDVPSVAGNHRR